MLRMNKTLLGELFDNPNPQPQRPEVKRIYLKLFNRIFPGDNLFVEYFKAQTFDKQYEYAERIIHRLCYESNFPPTYFALKDVITLEEYQNDRASEKSKYISRDHFAHVVNLYALGIYVFFYNSEFYKKIVSDNRYERSDSSHNQPKLDCVKDFISEWKYFCLYHDVGYVQELFGGTDYVKNAWKSISDLGKRENDFQASLRRDIAVKQISFFGTLEIMSRIFTWELVKAYSRECVENNSKLHKKINKCSFIMENGELSKVDVDEEIFPLVNGTHKLEKIYSNKCLKGLLSIIGENNVIVIGIHKNSGELAFVSYVKNNDRKLAFSKMFSECAEVARICHDSSLILFDDFIPDDFEFEYYVNYDRSDKQFLADTLLDEASIKFASLYVQNSDMGLRFAGITSEKQMLDFYFDIYEYLYTSLRQFITPGEDTKSPYYANKFDVFINGWDNIFTMNSAELAAKSIELSSVIYGLLENSYTKEIKEECLSYFQNLESVKKKINNICEDSISEKLIENVINGYFKIVNEIVTSEEEKRKLIASIDEKYNSKIEQAGALIKVYAYQYACLKSILLRESEFKYNFAYEKREEQFEWDCGKKLFQRKVTKYFNRPCDQIAEEYSLEHSKYDHGISSMEYASAMFQFLRDGIKKEKNSKEWKIIDILFSISNPQKNEDYVAQYITNYDHVFENTLFAIFVHNLYPSNFKDEKMKKYKTKISDPFTYFALVCDALQHWNRTMSISPSLLDVRPSERVSEEYNIVVRSDCIYLYEQGDEKFQTALAKNIDGLTYLDGIKAFLKDKYVMPDSE